jgi:hypothetical protein
MSSIKITVLLGLIIWSSCALKNTEKKELIDLPNSKAVRLEIKDSIPLKNASLLKFAENSEEQYLLLERNGKLIDTLTSNSAGLSMKNLGYLVKDYDQKFLFAQSFGSGNAHKIYLIDKINGKNKLGSNYNYFIDLDTVSQILLYSKSEVPSIGDTLFSINPVTGKKSYFEFPQIVLNEEEILNRVHISKVNGSEIIVEVVYENWVKKKSIELVKK